MGVHGKPLIGESEQRRVRHMIRIEPDVRIGARNPRLSHPMLDAAQFFDAVAIGPIGLCQRLSIGGEEILGRNHHVKPERLANRCRRKALRRRRQDKLVTCSAISGDLLVRASADIAAHRLSRKPLRYVCGDDGTDHQPQRKILALGAIKQFAAISEADNQ